MSGAVSTPEARENQDAPTSVLSSTRCRHLCMVRRDYSVVVAVFRRADALGGTGMIIREPGQSSADPSLA
ncbi:hypothetical protein JF66_01460 [Cryobacterium sp. MLB-32]|nr:hypothetical protein JF66_01460 [Cryobacterium sp. MLB-32]